MEIIAYTLEGCSSCGILKELFKRADVSYKEKMVNRDVTLEDFKQQFPEVSQFPFVVIDGEPIGGLIEVTKLFVQKGMVSSKKE
jgi:glutaredoxin